MIVAEIEISSSEEHLLNVKYLYCFTVEDIMLFLNDKHHSNVVSSMSVIDVGKHHLNNRFPIFVIVEGIVTFFNDEYPSNDLSPNVCN